MEKTVEKVDENQDEKSVVYAAAVIDAGSYFCIRKIKGSYASCIRIRRKSISVIKRLNETFGGYIGVSKTGEFYWLTFHGQMCTSLLERVLPHMSQKMEQARIILDFNEHIQERVRLGIKPGTRLDDQEKQYRQEMMEKLQTLNN